jgi:hypothetical protein
VRDCALFLLLALLLAQAVHEDRQGQGDVVAFDDRADVREVNGEAVDIDAIVSVAIAKKSRQVCGVPSLSAIGSGLQ